MNDLAIIQGSLPDTLEDLSKFVLIGRDKLQAVRAEISAIDKLDLAKEVHEQKLLEAQEITETVTMAEMRMGELFKQMPKATPNNNKFHESNTHVTLAKTKEETAKKLGFNKMQVSRLQQLADHPEIVHKAIQEARDNGDIASRAFVLGKIKKARKEERAQEKAARKAFTLDEKLPDDRVKLLCGDIRGGLPEIKDSSVDFIITDPPYKREYISLYSDLSRLANRVLKPNGSLLVMSGQSYLPEVINQLSSCMTYHWALAYLTPGGQSPQLFHKRVNTFWKPVLWFVKGEYNGDYVGDVLKSPANDNDKRFHEWGQSLGGIKDIVDRFTNPGDVILDPFLGGGTTGAAAVSMGRKFIGADIEQKNVDVSADRIKAVYENARC